MRVCFTQASTHASSLALSKSWLRAGQGSDLGLCSGPPGLLGTGAIEAQDFRSHYAGEDQLQTWAAAPELRYQIP